MPLNWDDDDEEELTEIEFKKRTSKVLVHDETTTSTAEPVPNARRRSSVQEMLYNTSPAQPLVHSEARPALPRPQVLGSYAPAATRDRFAAFLIDSLLAFYVYYILGYGLLKFFGLPNLQVLHQVRGRYAIHVVGALAIVFFYYVAMESVLGATLGKLFCRLRVIEENGRAASLGNVCIRNFLRIVDYPLGFFVAVIAMESSPMHQRLGDRAAKTLVIKKTRRYLSTVDLTQTPLASTLSRIFAETVDLLFSLTLSYGLFLLMHPNRPLLSSVIYHSIPIVFVLYYTALEFFSGSSPGKTLFKRLVVLDNGEPPDGTAALLRNLFRPVDYLLGYPLMTLSKRKQRLGDTVADTLVVAKSGGAKAMWTSLTAMILVFVVAYAGFHNQDNWIRHQYDLGPLEGIRVFIPGMRPPPKKGAAPLPTTSNPTNPSEKPQPSEKPKNLTPLPPSTSDKMSLGEFFFATGPTPGQIRKDAMFRSGDLIFVLFKIQGLKQNEKQEASVSEDLQVENPEGKIVVSQPNVVDLTKALSEDRSNMLFANQIKLAKEAPLGKYRAIFTVHDKVADTQYSFEKSFELQ